MRIVVIFRNNSDLKDKDIEQKNVGIEVGKGCLAVFPLDERGKSDGTSTLYPLDQIRSIHVIPEEETEVDLPAPTPIRRDLS